MAISSLSPVNKAPVFFTRIRISQRASTRIPSDNKNCQQQPGLVTKKVLIKSGFFGQNAILLQ